jgi:pimeloyl-ACP methyl ester carboxylesterase
MVRPFSFYTAGRIRGFRSAECCRSCLGAYAPSFRTSAASATRNVLMAATAYICRRRRRASRRSFHRACLNRGALVRKLRHATGCRHPARTCPTHGVDRHGGVGCQPSDARSPGGDARSPRSGAGRVRARFSGRHRLCRASRGLLRRPGRREPEAPGSALARSVRRCARLAAAIRGARLTIYQETGHCPNWERPERVAADLLGFLSKNSAER